MASHQATCPPLARDYFRRIGVEIDSYRDHPLIVQAYRPGRGWSRVDGRQRVSFSKIVKLRRTGVTEVCLSAGGHSPDFQVRELLRRDRRPLLGGSLIGSRRS